MASSPSTTCSRQLSREAMQILHKYFDRREDWPTSCQKYVHLLQSTFTFLNMYDRAVFGGRLRCGLCNKQFRNEHYLDGHFDRKHTEDHPGGICMAEFCDILNCPSHRALARHAKCTHSSARRLKMKCQDLFQTCFPYEEPSFNATTLRRGDPVSNRLYSDMLEHICDAISCEAQEVPDPPSVAYIMFETGVKFLVMLAFLLGVIFYFERPVRTKITRRPSRQLSTRRHNHYE
ncbi:hypothetical protein Ae201684P_015221 [Aphanomyces euteiches]|nr:hypothetical protein Ae201684P_015221 [Aphanomyces euteiches]